MIKTSPWTGGTDEEYETQHFGFGQQQLKNALRQMVEQKIQSSIHEMESVLKESGKLNNEEKFAVTNSCDKLIRIYCNRAAPCLAAIDEEIELLLKIPHNVLLPEDEIQLQQTSDDDYKKLQEEVDALKRRAEQKALMKVLLISEEKELASVEKLCVLAKKDMEVVDALQKTLEGSGNNKEILNGIQFLSASLPSAFATEEDDCDERTIFVE